MEISKTTFEILKISNNDLTGSHFVNNSLADESAFIVCFNGFLLLGPLVDR